jgi:flagellar hook-basal body complex protein FliE
MTDPEEEVADMKLQMGLLGRDVQQSTMLFDRLSQSIEKIQEVNVNLLRMIALHEEKHEQHERFQNTFQQDIKDLHSRITTVAREIQEMIEKKEQKILDCIIARETADQEEDSFLSIFKIGKFGKFIWAMIVMVFFIGYYTAKIQPIFESLLK